MKAVSSMASREACLDVHVHLGKSRDGATVGLTEIRQAMAENGITRAVVFGIDEPDAGPTYERTNERVLRALEKHSRLMAFARLNPKAGSRAAAELGRCIKRGARGVKLHPRSEAFSPQEAEFLIDVIEKEKLPVILHTSHEVNCRPYNWKPIFRRHRRVPFILAHGAKDAFEEAIEVARTCPNVWVETTTLSYWRTGVILKKLGPGRVVFGSDLPYSHPAVERQKFDLLLSCAGRRKVYFENASRILGE